MSMWERGAQAMREAAAEWHDAQATIAKARLDAEGAKPHPSTALIISEARLYDWHRQVAAAIRSLPLPPAPAVSEEVVERFARAICAADGDDPDRMTYHSVEPGVMEPYGPAWTRCLPAARAALSALSEGGR